AASAATGAKRIVTGSRHSTRPSTRGSMLKTRRGSTDASSPDAMGRSKVTVIASVASPSRSGDTRNTRSGSTETRTVPSVNSRAARAENIDTTWLGGGGAPKLTPDQGAGGGGPRREGGPPGPPPTPAVGPEKNGEGRPSG